MTAHQMAGATSHAAVGWHAIDWQQVNQNVRRLQARIVKAEQAGKRGKVKALQRLLTRSFSGKAFAVRRVTENQGKRTPGVDGQIWDTPQKKAAAVRTLRQHGYRPQPLRRVLIPKSNGKMRPLGIPTMADRTMQALYWLALDPIAETTGDPNSYGFRKGRSTADAMKQCHTLLSQKQSAPWVLEGDIKSCFDRISHEWLLTHIPIERTVLRKWLKAGFMQDHIFYATEEGTPQGGIISPVLANLTLDGLEQELHQAFPRRPRGSQASVNLVRYADDFIITGRTRELLETQVRPLVERFLHERGLELSEHKTSITHIEDGFDFLGKHVRKYKGKYLSKPSKKNLHGFLAKARGIIKANKQAPAGMLIVQLNSLIRGWTQYHRYEVSKAAFNYVDYAIFKCLWRWACRRHPGKAKRWVRKKYFGSDGRSNWMFKGEHEGKSRHLYRASRVPITAYTKIQSAANPYDPAWEVYFEERLGVKMAHDLKGRRQLLALWKEQNGKCPVCNEKITMVTGWHNHHIIWRCHGGKDGAENRVLLHPNCHRQVHSQGVYVEKPRPTRGERTA